MKKILLFLSFLILIGCNQSTEPDIEENIENIWPNVLSTFPNAFLTTGHDSDHTYISLEAVRTNSQHLKLNFEGWGILETGIFLSKNYSDSAINYQIMGRCGTVPTFTWVKVEFTDSLSPFTEDSLKFIRMRGIYNTLVLGKDSAFIESNFK